MSLSRPRATWGLAILLAGVGCGDDEGATSTSAGGAGGQGEAGAGAGTGGVGGSGGDGGAGGSGAGGSGPVEPPIVCTDQCLYVRSGATGSGDGSDWDDAFPSVPEALERGKVYLLADGDYGSIHLDDAEQGDVTIMLRKATVDDHGTDAGWQADFGDGVALFSEVSFGTGHYLLDGTRGGGEGAWLTGHGIEIERTGDGCEDNGSLITFGAGVSNVVVRHVRAHANNYDYPMNGVKGTAGATQLTFAFNAIHTTFGPTFHIGDWSDVTIERSYLADVRSTGAVDPFCPDWHAEGISSIGDNVNLTIRHNLWDEIGGTAVFAGVNTGSSTGWKIYGNTFARSVTTIAYYHDTSTTNVQTMNDLEFYNNNVVHMPGASQGALFIQAGANNRAWNNIFYDNIANSFLWAGVDNEHNYFSENRRVEGCDPICDKDEEGLTGDANGQIGEGSPFVAGDGDPTTADLRLAAPTEGGATLPSPFDVDPAGAPRGADGTWDRGAYEHAR